jgi:hypothetical protein
MKIRVTLDDQPLEFIGRQSPDNRRALREALHEIERGEVSPEPLEGKLAGFYKFKVSDFRLILQALPGDTGPRLRVVFAERRNIVYELFKQLLGLN